MFGRILVMAIAAMPVWMVVVGFAFHAATGFTHVDDDPGYVPVNE